MTPEQQREQWLKRVLPALAVLVVYFAIISGFVTEKSKKAVEQYQSMKGKGIDAATLPGIGQQHQGIRTEIANLETESKAAQVALQAKSGFLSRSGSVNDTIERIGLILADNSLQVLEEKRNDKPGKETLPKSISDTQRRLKDIASVEAAVDAKTPVPPALKTAVPADNTVNDKDLNIWTIRYVGTYLDNYRALSSLADSDTRALPVSLKMQAYKSTNDSDAGKQEWLLTLWL